MQFQRNYSLDEAIKQVLDHYRRQTSKADRNPLTNIETNIISLACLVLAVDAKPAAAVAAVAVSASMLLYQFYDRYRADTRLNKVGHVFDRLAEGKASRKNGKRQEAWNQFEHAHALAKELEGVCDAGNFLLATLPSAATMEQATLLYYKDEYDGGLNKCACAAHEWKRWFGHDAVAEGLIDKLVRIRTYELSAFAAKAVQQGMGCGQCRDELASTYDEHTLAIDKLLLTGKGHSTGYVDALAEFFKTLATQHSVPLDRSLVSGLLREADRRELVLACAKHTANRGYMDLAMYSLGPGLFTKFMLFSDPIAVPLRRTRVNRP